MKEQEIARPADPQRRGGSADRRARELSGGNEPVILDTLGAACAEAVAAARRAIAIAGDGQDLKSLRSRKELGRR